MKVAFTVFGGTHWTGGINYLENLFSALAELPDCAVRPILFVGTDTDPQLIARLAPYLSGRIVVSPAWNSSGVMRTARLACAFGLQRDYLVEREFRRAGIDLVFQHFAWYGYRFGIPTLGWIADFQHRRVPAMFSKARFLWRDIGYRVWTHCATRILVSSQDARRDCERFYPASQGRTEVLPFVVKGEVPVGSDDAVLLRATYGLPEKFYYLPNQLWKHKNHVGVIDALQRIRLNGGAVVVVASGSASDTRHPDFPQQLLKHVQDLDLANRFVFLGMIPYRHVLALMRLCVAVINPSLSEGWSTTVEEAKAIGTPLLLSDLPIHREQTGATARYFDPANSVDIAQALESEWLRLPAGPRLENELRAAVVHRQRRRDFAATFEEIARRTICALRTS